MLAGALPAAHGPGRRPESRAIAPWNPTLDAPARPTERCPDAGSRGPSADRTCPRTARDPDAPTRALRPSTSDAAPHVGDWFSSVDAVPRAGRGSRRSNGQPQGEREATRRAASSRDSTPSRRAPSPRPRAAAHPRRRRLGQDPRARASRRVPDRRQGREAVADPRGHVHQQGRGRDARADHRPRRRQGARRRHGHLPLAVRARAAPRRRGHRHRSALRDLRHRRPDVDHEAGPARRWSWSARRELQAARRCSGRSAAGRTT